MTHTDKASHTNPRCNFYPRQVRRPKDPTKFTRNFPVSIPQGECMDTTTMSFTVSCLTLHNLLLNTKNDSPGGGKVLDCSNNKWVKLWFLKIVFKKKKQQQWCRGNSMHKTKSGKHIFKASLKTMKSSPSSASSSDPHTFPNFFPKRTPCPTTQWKWLERRSRVESQQPSH